MHLCAQNCHGSHGLLYYKCLFVCHLDCSIAYLYPRSCLLYVQPATKTFQHPATNLSAYIKRYINIMCRRERGEGPCQNLAARDFSRKTSTRCWEASDVPWYRKRLKIPLRWSVSAVGKLLPDPKSDHWFNP